MRFSRIKKRIAVVLTTAIIISQIVLPGTSDAIRLDAFYFFNKELKMEAGQTVKLNYYIDEYEFESPISIRSSNPETLQIVKTTDSYCTLKALKADSSAEFSSVSNVTSEVSLKNMSLRDTDDGYDENAFELGDDDGNDEDLDAFQQNTADSSEDIFQQGDGSDNAVEQDLNASGGEDASIYSNSDTDDSIYENPDGDTSVSLGNSSVVVYVNAYYKGSIIDTAKVIVKNGVKPHASTSEESAEDEEGDSSSLINREDNEAPFFFNVTAQKSMTIKLENDAEKTAIIKCKIPNGVDTSKTFSVESSNSDVVSVNNISTEEVQITAKKTGVVTVSFVSYATGLRQVKALTKITVKGTISSLATPKISLTAKKKTVSVRWGKVAGATGYQVRWSSNKKWNSKNVADTSFSFKGQKGKTYRVQVRALLNLNGYKKNGSFSTVKRKTIK